MGAVADFTVVTQLLNAKAEPLQRHVGGADPFMAAAFLGRHENIDGWLAYFGGTWIGLEHKDPVSGFTPLLLTALYDGGRDVMQALLAAKANPRHIADDGCNAIHL